MIIIWKIVPFPLLIKFTFKYLTILFVPVPMGEESKESQEIDDECINLEDPDPTEPTDSKRLLPPPWTKQLTLRGLVASLVIGIMYSIIVMKLNLTTGLVPTLNVSAALLAFVFLRTWTNLLRKLGILTAPLTQQENTVVQTCAVACYSIAVGGSHLVCLSLDFDSVGWFFVCALCGCRGIWVLSAGAEQENL